MNAARCTYFLKAMVVSLITLTVSSLALPVSNAAEPIRIRFAHHARPDIAAGVRIQAFVDRVHELGKGRIVIENHHSGKLLQETAAARGVMQGNVEMGSTASGNLAPLTGAYGFLELPFLFENLEDVINKVLRGDIGQEIANNEMEKRLGLKVLMYNPSGQFQQLANTKHEVRKPADLKGLKIRTRPSPMEISIVKNLGGMAVPVDWGETFTAVQQGTVDGLVSQYLWLDATKLNEVIKHVTEININMPCGVIYMNAKVWNGLPADIQAIIQKAAIETEPLGMKLDKEQDGEYKERLKKMGIGIYVPNTAEKAQWREGGYKVYDDMKDKFSPDFIKRVQAAVARR
jgi:TRAP-type C4-dicarboxylate transport system substrate-binding protein